MEKKGVIAMSRLIQEMSEDLSEYLKDESRTSGHADSISFPKSEEEAAEIVRICAEKNEPVTIQGARTGLAAGAVPSSGHIMSMIHMTKVCGLRESGDGAFLITTEPGLTLMDLRKMVHEKRFPEEQVKTWDEESLKALRKFEDAEEFFFPPDPTETTAALGGIAACNSSGACTYRYGQARNYIDGLHVLLADGSLLKLNRGEIFAEGRTLKIPMPDGTEKILDLPTYQMPDVKNASGYYAADDMDAIDLFIGSDGTLGVITQLTLRLIPKPAYTMAVNSFFETERAALDYVMAVRPCSENITALEYFDGGALDILRTMKKENEKFAALPELPENKNYCVYTEIKALDEDTVMDSMEQVAGILEECGVGEEDSWIADSASALDEMHFFRHAVPESTNMMIDERKRVNPEITKLGSDMSVPDDCLYRVMELYRNTIAAHGLKAAVWGHIGNNHLHVNILPENGEEYRMAKEMFREEWAPAVSEMGGAVSAEHGVGKVKRDFLIKMYGLDHVKEMAGLKRQLDPRGMFGRGNLFGEDLL